MALVSLRFGFELELKMAAAASKWNVSQKKMFRDWMESSFSFFGRNVYSSVSRWQYNCTFLVDPVSGDKDLSKTFILFGWF